MDKTEIQWFPMRATYNRELKIKKCLDGLGIECFLPVKQIFIEKNGQKKLEVVPAIHNLLFVKSTQEQLTHLKTSNSELEPLRYMMTHSLDNNCRSEIITIPERQMNSFIRVASLSDSMYVDYSKVANKMGKRVVITEGELAGIEGVIVRIKKNKRVVIKLEGVVAVALAFVSPSIIKFL